MKSEKIKLSFQKFKIAEIKRPEYIVGGGDDQTIGDVDKKKVCRQQSKIWVDPK